MKIGLVQDGASPRNGGSSSVQRVDELIEEATFAEEMGFDFYGLSEVHFTPDMTVSSPEIILAVIAARTSRMRLRFVSMPLLAFNHPIRVAERIATLDLVSHGRIELGAARSNQAHTIEAFGIPVDKTREQYVDSIEVVLKALTDETFAHDGPVWKIPERTLFPKPVQRPHPPLFASATSIDTHRFAGEQGLGIMSGNSLSGGWSFVQQCIDLYRSSWQDAGARGRATNSTFSVLALRAHCAETNELAQAEAQEAAFSTVDLVMRWYAKLAKQADDYSYLAQIGELEEHRRDLPFMIERAPYLTIGDPDFFVERIRRLEQMGADELILEIDGLGHEKHMQAIELIGRHVLPSVHEAAEPLTPGTQR
jgi:alkanesulfonate monooxygenase SsuD/methylene tetrahydromethanopterin reductase-like flavin-dependent oxidoreductase (luciferase family)